MPHAPLHEERLTGSVIGAFHEVYDTLGFGFLEHLSMPRRSSASRAPGGTPPSASGA